MQAARWGWNVIAVALIGVSGLTMTHFAATQEAPPKKKTDATPKKGTQAEKKEEEKTPQRKGISIFMRMKLDPPESSVRRPASCA